MAFRPNYWQFEPKVFSSGEEILEKIEIFSGYSIFFVCSFENVGDYRIFKINSYSRKIAQQVLGVDARWDIVNLCRDTI